MPVDQLELDPAHETNGDSAIARNEQKFVRLRDDWKQKRGPDSSAARLAMHPSYLKIIGMSPDAIPFLLRELENQPDLWFVALRSITETDPVPDAIRGNVNAMAEAWLQWGKDQG
jgi:hypothetical protein